MKKIKLIFIILLIFVIIIVLSKNLIVKAGIVGSIKALTGFGVKVGSANLGLFKTALSLERIKILNPGNFKERVMADLPEIYADYNLKDFFKGKAHFEELRINLEELIVVVNEANEVNVKLLQERLTKKGGKEPQVQIDVLDLKIHKVIYKSYSQGKLDSREFNVNIHERLKDVTNPRALVSLILVKALAKTSIPSLADIDLSQLKDISRDLIEKTGSSVLEEFQKILP